MQEITLLVLAALQSASALHPAARRAPAPLQDRPNLVVILADDMGVDLLGAYGEGSSPPCTPNLDQLASEGLLFRNAWANPTCSPTRAALLSGRYGFRTGVGNPMGALLPLSETLLPEVLEGYASAALGKWHLGSGAGPLHPNASGFGRYAGNLAGQVPSYTAWTKTEDGVSAETSVYATTDTADEAILAVQTLPEPWLIYVSFNAPHTPTHVPPATLCPCPSGFCATNPPGAGVPARTKAMVEALDAEIGRLLAALAQADPDAYVFFAGDNGTAGLASESPFLPAHAKGTLFEGGVNVPLLVRGPDVVAGECAALVSTVDLFATCAELAGVTSLAEDSLSLVPYFADPSRASLRETVYAETFAPNGGAPPFASHTRALRDARWKLIRESGVADRFYDLTLDPFETTDLLPTLVSGSEAWQRYQALAAELAALGVG